MITFIILLLVLAALIGSGFLAVRYGADSRTVDPRDPGHSWH